MKIIVGKYINMDYKKAYHELEHALEQADEAHQQELQMLKTQPEKLKKELKTACQQIVALQDDLQSYQRKSTPKKASLVAKPPSVTREPSELYTQEDMDKVQQAALRVIEDRDGQIAYLNDMVSQLMAADATCKSIQKNLERNVQILEQSVKTLQTDYRDLQQECERGNKPRSASRSMQKDALEMQLENQKLVEENQLLKQQKAEQEALREALQDQYRAFLKHAQRAVKPEQISWLESVKRRILPVAPPIKKGGTRKRRHQRK